MSSNYRANFYELLPVDSNLKSQHIAHFTMLLCNVIIELTFKNSYPQIVILKSQLATHSTTSSNHKADFFESIPADSSFQKSARVSFYYAT